ncbi:MAG: hypothetical protein V2A77_10175 [Pseudomonadota bacterium]
MWWSERTLDPQAVIWAQLVVEAVLVVMVGLLLWRRPKQQNKMDAPPAREGVMAATENLLRRLEEKRHALESAVDGVRLKADQGALLPANREAAGQKKHPLEQAAKLAARGMSSADIARELGVPRGEVEMYLSLRQAGGR